MSPHHALTLQVQRACIVALVTGYSFPPLRLDLIKKLNTPAFSEAYGCDEEEIDCKEPKPCKGNRIEISAALNDEGEELEGEEELRICIVHGKNDTCVSRCQYQVEFAYPRGDALDLLFIHIREGRDLLTLERADDEVSGRLFVTNGMNDFNDQTFNHYWHTTMDSTAPGIEYFPPVMARTIFVEGYAGEGSTAEFWEGASCIMGNTPEQWNQSYFPAQKRKKVQEAVRDVHRRRVAAEAAAADAAGPSGS